MSDKPHAGAAALLKQAASSPHPVMVPLGGVGRIGLNWTLYGFRGTWLLVDAGIGFPDPSEGDYIVPHPELVRTIAPMVGALVVTHAHEDHIGAIHHLWPSVIRCPILATPFASEIIKGRLRETGGLDKVEVRSFRPGAGFNLGQFGVETASVAHSAPQCVALRLRAGGVTILHTGDWKDDPCPLIGKGLDKARLASWGRAGVDFLVGDSTNADRDADPTGEADVLDGLREVMESSRGMVVVGTFGSNVSRIAASVTAASMTGRHAAMMGRSVRNAEEVARGLGLLNGVPHFLAHPAHLQALDRHEMAVVCTGTQGEENAALWRLARGDGGAARLERGDTVVISAREIPGREEGIAAMKQAMRDRGVTVLTGRDLSPGGHPLHVTGHACAGEIRALHALVRPRTVVPVHGEEHHLLAHAELARDGGFGCHLPAAGDAVELRPGGGTALVGRMDVPLKVESRPEEYQPAFMRR